MFAFAYPAKLTTGSDGRILVEFVDLPKVASDGKDEREAFEEAMDALGSDLSIRLSRREEIPPPSAAKRKHRLVPVPLWLAPKLALYLAMRDQNVNNSEMSRRLGVHERVIRRVLDPQHATKAEKVQAALAVLGKQLTLASPGCGLDSGLRNLQGQIGLLHISRHPPNRRFGGSGNFRDPCDGLTPDAP